MSSTNRGTNRNGFDEYPTPVSAIDSFLNAWDGPKSGRWLEPCAGEGRIIQRVEAFRAGVWADRIAAETSIHWHAWEIQQKYQQPLEALGARVKICDTLVQAPLLVSLPQGSGHFPFDVAITNPPYCDAMEMLIALRRIAHTVVFLLRRNFIGSAKRAEYLRHNMPDEYLLPRRPSFVWRHTYWLRCTKCAHRVKVVEDVPAKLPASKLSDYVRYIAGIDYEHDRSKCTGHGHMLLAAEVDSYNPKTDKTKTTTSDSCEYCWCVFNPDSGPVGTTRMLALPPEGNS